MFGTDPTQHAISEAAKAHRRVFWLDDATRPAPRTPLAGHHGADLAVIGAGFTGLWTALRAKQRYPDLDVVVLEGGRIADGASGRNGGFCSHSLTHGIGNGLSRWPNDMRTLTRLGMENLDGIVDTIREFDIDCDLQETGELDVAVAAHQVDDLREYADASNALGVAAKFLEQDDVRAYVASPTYLAGVLQSGVIMVNPAKLAWGLADACEKLGVRIYEHSPVTNLTDVRDRVLIDTKHGRIVGKHLAIATSAFPPLLRRVRNYVVPVYDYVLMTEPLTDAQRASIGWSTRFGMSDAGNQFHYYRMTEDGRILWGGYDAVYHSGNGFGPRYENDDDSYARLAHHFYLTFPQLEEVGFSHAWGGGIDTCSRFSAFWGTAHAGKTAYVAGFTGLGVGASRFAGDVMLDLLMKEATERTELEMVRTKPIPFPPEPARSIGIALTTKSLQQADRNGGRRNLWLRTLDALGLGFDS